MNNSFIASLKRCSERAENLCITLELCTSTAELTEALEHMGFKCYEYAADAIYVDGDKQHPIKGVTKLFTEWARTDEALGFTDIIDVNMGCIKVTSHNDKWCNATQLLSLRMTKTLGLLN